MTESAHNEPPAAPGPLALTQHGEELGVFEFGPGADVPGWATSSVLFSVTATASETTVICGTQTAPRKLKPLGRYAAFSVAGRLDPELTGVLHGLLGPLASAEIPVFTVSTAPTDWVLVPVARAAEAAEEWRRCGYAVEPATLPTSGKN